MSPSLMHESILALFRNRPSLAPEILGDALGVALPEYDEARVDSAKLTEITPVEYDADLVVLLVGERPVLGIVVEIQLAQDEDKRWSWPYYVAALRARLRSPVMLLVVCPTEPVARWCARPIELGDGTSVVAPLVLGPDAVPLVTDHESAAEKPELAVLSSLAHGKGDRGLEVGIAATRAATSLDDERALFYADLVLTALGEAARKALRELMSQGAYEYQSDFARKYYGLGKADGRAEGKAEGKAEAILAVLRHRGLDVSPAAEAALRTCADLAKLEEWLARAMTVASADDLLE